MKKKLLVSAIASVLVVGVGAEAADFKASGQVNRVIVSPDDDLGNEIQFLDNNMSGSRFRFTGTEDIGNDMKAGFRLEAQLQSNKSNGVNGGTFTDSTSGNLGGKQDNIDLRYQDVYLSGAFGKVSLGKGDGAGNGTTEADLSGTDVVAASYSTDLYGGFVLLEGDTAATPAVANLKVGDVYDSVDAYSRVNRLRYDSNNFNGFSFAASYGQQETVELAAKFAGGTDVKYEVQAFVGSRGENMSDEASLDYNKGDERMGISGSVLLSNGLNATVSLSEQDQDQNTKEDRQNAWLKLGYKMSKHAFSVDYGKTEDTIDSPAPATESTTDTMALSYVFAPAKGVELYAEYREYNLDDNLGTDPEFYTVGSRVKF